MWRKIQDFMRKYRLIFGKIIWDHKKHKEKIQPGNFIEQNHIQSILFLRQDGKVGDMVVHTFLFREIKKRYPNIKISVITRGAARGIIEENPYIDMIYDYQKKKKEIQKLAKKIAREKYDLLVDFSIMLRVRDMMLLSLCKVRYNMGVNRKDWELFDISIPFDFQSHITNMYAHFLEYIGVEFKSKEYELFSTPLSIDNQHKVVLLNPYASTRRRSFSEETCVRIGREVLSNGNVKIYVVGEPSKRENLESIAEKIGEGTQYYATPKIQELVSLVQRADLIISPDTAVVHIASAFQKKMLAFYLEDTEEIKYAAMWLPNTVNARVLYAKNKDMNQFSWEEMKKELSYLMKNL